LDGQQGRLGENRPKTGQFPETGGGPDAVVRRLDPAQSGLRRMSRRLGLHAPHRGVNRNLLANLNLPIDLQREFISG